MLVGIKGNIFLSYCKLFVVIYGSIFEKFLDENLNLALAPRDTSSRRSLSEASGLESRVCTANLKVNLFNSSFQC